MSFFALLAVATTTGDDDSATAVTIGVWVYVGLTGTGVATTAVTTGAVAAEVSESMVTFVDSNELYRPDCPVLALQAPSNLYVDQSNLPP